MLYLLLLSLFSPSFIFCSSFPLHEREIKRFEAHEEICKNYNVASLRRDFTMSDLKEYYSKKEISERSDVLFSLIQVILDRLKYEYTRFHIIDYYDSAICFYEVFKMLSEELQVNLRSKFANASPVWVGISSLLKNEEVWMEENFIPSIKRFFIEMYYPKNNPEKDSKHADAQREKGFDVLLNFKKLSRYFNSEAIESFDPLYEFRKSFKLISDNQNTVQGSKVLFPMSDECPQLWEKLFKKKVVDFSSTTKIDIFFSAIFDLFNKKRKKPAGEYFKFSEDSKKRFLEYQHTCFENNVIFMNENFTVDELRAHADKIIKLKEEKKELLTKLIQIADDRGKYFLDSKMESEHSKCLKIKQELLLQPN